MPDCCNAQVVCCAVFQPGSPFPPPAFNTNDSNNNSNDNGNNNKHDHNHSSNNDDNDSDNDHNCYNNNSHSTNNNNKVKHCLSQGASGACDAGQPAYAHSRVQHLTQQHPFQEEKKRLHLVVIDSRISMAIYQAAQSIPSTLVLHLSLSVCKCMRHAVVRLCCLNAQGAVHVAT